MDWILLAILSPFLMSFTNLMEKFLVDKKIRHHSAIPIFGGIISFLIGTMIFIFHGVTILPISQMLILLSSGVLLIVYLLPYFEAISIDDSSRVVPLYQFVPIYVAIASYVLLHETLSPTQLLAFVCIVFGGFLLGLEKSDTTIFKPRKSFLLVVISGLIVSLVEVLFKFGYVMNDFLTTLAYQSVGGAIGAGFLLFSPRIKREFFAEYVRIKPWTFVLLLSNKLLEFVAQLCALVAITMAPVALVTVFGGLQSFFVLVEMIILSVWFPHILQENISKHILLQKILSLILIFIGISILSFA